MPETPRRAVEDDLAVLDDAASVARRRSSRSSSSPADPASRWTGAASGLAAFAYETNDLTDLDHAIIVDVEPTTAIRQAEVTVTKWMIELTRERLPRHSRETGPITQVPRISTVSDPNGT